MGSRLWSSTATTIIKIFRTQKYRLAGNDSIISPFIISSLLIIYAAWLWLQTRSVVRDPVQKIYQRFCQKLARRGYPRLPHEGPTTYAARISAARPDLRQKLDTIIALYVQTRYRSQPEKQVAFRQAVRQFRFF
jgi:hypothetical protein